MNAAQIIDAVTATLRRDARFPKLSSLDYACLFADLQRNLENKIECRTSDSVEMARAEGFEAYDKGYSDAVTIEHVELQTSPSEFVDNDE